MHGKYGPLVGAVDQGTSSTRFLVFAASTAELIAYHQIELKPSFPKEGWVEMDPHEILSSTTKCIEETTTKLKAMEVDPADIRCIGITNQRETTVVWDPTTGRALHSAIVWLDTRSTDTVDSLLARLPGKNKDYFKEKCGLPVSTYFSAVKIRWLLDNVSNVKKAVDDRKCLFGTVDSWLIWNLLGGVGKGAHITDVTNASRTMLMDIESLQWDPEICSFFNIPSHILPAIRSSSEIYGNVDDGPLKGIPISGCLGDQQAALVGQMCLKKGQAKNTYGTGCFLLYNTGTQPVISQHGLLTTVAYKFGKNGSTVYALEGSIAIAGACVTWLRDNLGFFKSSADIESLADSVECTHGTYFVPAFSGLYAPYWERSARGIICGLSQFTTKAHIARAALESVCFQTKEILDAMNLDSGIPLCKLQVDGGMTQNNLLMQLQADLLGINVVRPSMPELTALGAAMAAGVANGIDVWSLDPDNSTDITTDTFLPTIGEDERYSRYTRWKDAVSRCKHWETKDVKHHHHHAVSSKLNVVIPGLFLISTFGILILSKIMNNR